jgi:hypothetical protein
VSRNCEGFGAATGTLDSSGYPHRSHRNARLTTFRAREQYELGHPSGGGLGKAPEGWRSPRRFALSGVAEIRASPAMRESTAALRRFSRNVAVIFSHRNTHLPQLRRAVQILLAKKRRSENTVCTMQFEVKIGGNEVWIMRVAGVQMGAYQELFHQVISKKAKLPAVVTCSYFLSDVPVNVQITVLEFGHLKIEAADAEIGKKMQAEISRYTAPNVGSVVADEEHKALYARIGKILEPDGVTPQDVEANKVTLSRRAQEGLMALCEQTHHAHRGKVYWQFTKSQIPKEDRAFVARWLVKRFALEKDPCVRNDIETVFLNHRDLVLRELAEDVIQLINEPRYGVSRSGLIDMLPKTKHPRAADVIASVMDEDRLAWSALRSLGVLKAKQYEPRIRKYLRDADSEVRLEAKRALKKMGCLVETAPPPVHLVKNRKLLPKGLEEWSANLDFENLEPVLQTLTGCVDGGFGAQEIAEVVGVAEETRPEKTRAFRFSVTANGRKSELWVVVFMDDIDSPDLYVHGELELIKRFEATVDLKE